MLLKQRKMELSRHNPSKTLYIDSDNAIQKSNALSTSLFSFGLTLNQTQLLAFAIYCTQKNNINSFNKSDFEQKFNIKQLRSNLAIDDAEQLFKLSFSLKDYELEKASFIHVFRKMEYEKGKFMFTWEDEILPHILDLQSKGQFVLTDLTLTAKFKSVYSWVLYDFLRGQYGKWYIKLKKDKLLEVFSVQGNESYINNTTMFYKRVLKVAIDEINEHTELHVTSTPIKEGRKVVGYELDWSTGKKVNLATQKQIDHLQKLLDCMLDDVSRFIVLLNEKNAAESLKIVRKSEELRKYSTKENLDSENKEFNTKEDLDKAIKQATQYFKQLNSFLEQEQKKTMPESIITYDWT